MSTKTARQLEAALAEVEAQKRTAKKQLQSLDPETVEPSTIQGIIEAQLAEAAKAEAVRVESAGLNNAIASLETQRKTLELELREALDAKKSP